MAGSGISSLHAGPVYNSIGVERLNGLHSPAMNGCGMQHDQSCLTQGQVRLRVTSEELVTVGGLVSALQNDRLRLEAGAFHVIKNRVRIGVHR